MRISYLFGSPSDDKVFNPGLEILKKSGVEFDFRCLSAHRVPDGLRDYLKGYSPDVVIAGAGLTNALANVCTEYAKVVIGVPIGGLDSFLSTVQTPPNYPVATVPVDRADISARIAVGLNVKPVVYTQLSLPKEVVDVLDKLCVPHEALSTPDQLVGKSGVVLASYESINELVERSLDNSNFFIIGVNSRKLAQDKYLDWMTGFSKLSNTVIVGNSRFENAALLAAQVLSIHDTVVLENIKKYREPGIKKYDQYLWTRPSKIIVDKNSGQDGFI